ncbi:MAG TPA: DUF3450 family protein [Verrucomicrobiota bacterium]|nr:DUF3450 family protein [Verrucomicrobiota bacterium]
MNRTILWGTLAVIAAGVAGSPVRAESAVNETRSTLEKWVETRQLISKTKSDWQADKDTIEQTIALFERELKSIATQMGNVSTNRTQVDVEREKAQAEQKELQQAAETVKTLVVALETKLLSLAPAFPPPLTEKIQPLLQRIPTGDANTRVSGAERMQTVVGILNEVDKFNAAVTVVSEIQKSPSGAEVQVETIYVGLGQAYFVDKAGDYAGVGIPTANGWQWKEQKDLAGKIQKSLAMYRNAAPAAFVSLPVEIK